MKKFEHGGNVYESGQVNEWLDMSANINPFGMSEAVKSAIMNNIDGLIHYPDPLARELKLAITKRYKVKDENIITLNGAAEFFYLYFNSIRPKKVLIVEPSFSEYEKAALSARCEIKFFYTNEEENFKINYGKLKQMIQNENVDCLMMASPNNPTGEILNAVEIERLLEIAPTVLVDESFIDFVEDEKSVKRLIAERKNLIVVTSMTKFYAIPGLRLGYAIAEEKLIEQLNLSKDVWNVNHLAQKAGVIALTDNEYIKRTKDWLKVERKFVFERLKQINKLKVFEPTVNFVLIKFESEIKASEVLNKLKYQKILLRSCSNFRGLDGRYIRMAIKIRTDNERTIRLIERVMGNDENHVD